MVGVLEAVRVHAEGAPRLRVAHPRPAEAGLEARGAVLGPPPPLLVVGMYADREEGPVAGGDRVHVVPRPPELDQRGVRPRGRLGSLHASVDGEQRGSRHAVLQARPGGLPKRVRSGRKPSVERASAATEGEDLRPREMEQRRVHRSEI